MYSQGKQNDRCFESVIWDAYFHFPCSLFSASFFDRMNKGKLKMVNKSDNNEILLKP